MNLINLINFFMDNGHQNSNEFPQIAMKSIYLFLKND